MTSSIARLDGDARARSPGRTPRWKSAPHLLPWFPRGRGRRSRGAARAPARAWTRGRLASFLAALAACSPGFDDPSLVKDLRVLGVRADPPEFLVTDKAPPAWPVRVTALIADPHGGGRTLQCEVRSCTLGDSRTCEGSGDITTFAAGPCTDGETPFDVEVPRSLVEAAQAGDPTFGTPVHSGVAVWLEVVVRGGERPLYALKSVAFSPENPPGRTANQNPRVGEVRLNDMPQRTPGEVPYVPGVSVRIEVVPAEGAKEKYVLPSLMPPGGVEDLDEFMTVAFYADAGSFEDATRSDRPGNVFEGTPTGEEARLLTRWTPPDEGGPVRFWFVLVDGRGGADWVVASGVPSGP